MKRLITEEERLEIPCFNETWEAVKVAITQRMKAINPVKINGFNRYQLSLYNIKIPKNAFFNILRVKLDLYLAETDEIYNKIPDDYNAAEIDTNLRLMSNGKIERLDIFMKIATKEKTVFNDILPEFYHEMTHAYDYFKRLQNGGRFDTLRANSTYSNESFNKIIYSNKLSALEKNVAILFYLLDDDEYRARLNSFYSEISNIDLSRGSDANIICNTKSWKKVNSLFFIIDEMEKANDNMQQKLLYVANIMHEKINKSQYSTFVELLTDVKDKYQTLRTDSWRDFCRILYNVKNKRR